MKTKSLFRTFALLCLFIGSTTAFHANSFEVDGIYYNFNSDPGNSVSVTQSTYSGNIVIPETVKYYSSTYRVTGIEHYAFKSCSQLSSVSLPNSVTHIDREAFKYCWGLTSIDLASVEIIGEEAFYHCDGLANVIIPNTVTNIESDAFSYCPLTSVTIPSSVTRIVESAFRDCTNLARLIIDENNPKYDSRNNCNAIIVTQTNRLIYGCKNTVIPNTVTTIGSFAFHGCTGLTSIVIPNSVTYIAHWAFHGCNSLTKVTSLSTTPPQIYEGSTNYENNDCFSTYGQATLYVPKQSIEAYSSADGWKKFYRIKAIEDIEDYDVNLDGEVNIADVNKVIEFILSGNVNTVGDVNNDGEVNIADINAIIKAILSN